MRPKTLAAFSEDQRNEVHSLLATRVAFMMGRKFEENDWASVYCRAKGLPDDGWSNLNLDIMHDGLGVEHKMLCYRSGINLADACGKTLMHPSATRSIRVPPITTDPDEAMLQILGQYADFLNARRAKVMESRVTRSEPDMRTGWLLWQVTLRQFLYFEEEMLIPNPDDYSAKWIERSASGARKESTNLWIYEKNPPGSKRFSVTTSAGAKIQPYFDVPPPSDPNLYLFTVIGEVVKPGMVQVWITEATARELMGILHDLGTETLSRAILEVAAALSKLDPVKQASSEVARPLLITQEAYEALNIALPGVSDEHSFQLLAQHIRRALRDIES